ncbi:hypothetical protein BDZ89DRAFT_1128120 [Hymenopellis radicata]|nr:hypothetical protein BDZ89DRAFT_1128120 [Hymenopellis radicata]
MRTKPGRLEQFHFTKVAVHIDSCVVSGAEYRNSNEDVVLTRDILYPALRQVIQTHAALGVRVVFKPQSVDDCSFVKLDKVDLDKHVQFISGGDLEHIMQTQLSTEFDTAAKGPLWRVLVLDAHIVLFSFHHGIGDGLSGLGFHTALLRALSSPSSESDAPESVVAVPDLELTPPIESAPQPVHTHFMDSNRFSATELARFHSACRSNNATITSALYVLAVAAISEVIGETQYRTLSGAVPISLRGLSGTPSEAFSCEASVYNAFPHIDNAFSWEMAREIFIWELWELLPGHFGQKRPYTFALSNLGVFDGGDTTRAWRVNGMWFGQSDAYVGAAIKLNVVGLLNGGLTVCLTSGLSAVGDAMFDDIANRIGELFRALV